MYRKVLVALVAILVLCVTAASAANEIAGGMTSDGQGSYASVMTGVVNGDIISSSGSTSADGAAYATLSSEAYGDGVVQQSATGNLYTGVNSLSATYTTAGSSTVDQLSNYGYNGYGPVANAQQSSAGSGRSIFSIVSTENGYGDYSTAFVVVKDGKTSDPVMTAHLDALDTSASLHSYDPNQVKIPLGAEGSLVSAGTVSNYVARDAVYNSKTSALSTNGGMTTVQMSGAGLTTAIHDTNSTLLPYAATLNNPEDTVGILFTGGATSTQTTDSYGSTNIVGSSATATSGNGYDTGSAWAQTGSINGVTIWEYRGTVSTSQTAAATVGEAASFQIAKDVTGEDAKATTNAHDSSGNTASSSVSSQAGSLNTFQASGEGNSANSLQNALGYTHYIDADVQATTCAVDESGANANTNMKVTGGFLKSGAYSKANTIGYESQQQGYNNGIDGIATTYANKDGATGSTITSYRGNGYLSLTGSGSTAAVVPFKQATAWQTDVVANGSTSTYTNEHSTVLGYGIGVADATTSLTDGGTLNVGNAYTKATNHHGDVATQATQNEVSTNTGVDATATTYVLANHVSAGTTDTVTNGQLAVDKSKSYANEYDGYDWWMDNAGADQSGVSIAGSNVNAVSTASTGFNTGTQASHVDDGSVTVSGTGDLHASANLLYGEATASGVTVTGDPGYVRSSASGAGYNAVANAEFGTGIGSITVSGTQSASASGMGGAEASQKGVTVTGNDIQADTSVGGTSFHATALGNADSGTVSVTDTQSAKTGDWWGATAENSGTTAKGTGASVFAASGQKFGSYSSIAQASASKGIADVYGTQKSTTGWSSSVATQVGVKVNGTGVDASSSAYGPTYNAYATGNADAGAAPNGAVVEVKDYQTASVDSNKGWAENKETTATGTSADVFATSSSNKFSSTAGAHADSGSASVTGDQKSITTSSSSTATQKGVSASGTGVGVSASADGWVFHSSTAGTTGTGSVTVGSCYFDGQEAKVTANDASASQSGVKATGTEAGSNPNLMTSANGNGNSAVSTAGIPQGSVSGSQSDYVDWTDAKSHQNVVVKGQSGSSSKVNGYASVSADTALANSGASAGYSTNGGSDQVLATSQNADATTNMLTGYRDAGADQSAYIKGYNGQTSTDATAESSWFYPDASASTSASFTGKGSLEESNWDRSASSATIDGYGADRQASAEQNVDLHGSTVSATTSVDTGFNTHATTTATASGNSASLETDQYAQSTTDVISGYRSAFANQEDLEATGNSASASSSSDAGFASASANAQFSDPYDTGSLALEDTYEYVHGHWYHGYWVPGYTIETPGGQSATATSTSWFGSKSASADNTGLNIETPGYHTSGEATTSASTDWTHWASTKASYGEGGGYLGNGGIIGDQSSSVTPSTSIAEQDGKIWGGETGHHSNQLTYPTATASAQHGWWIDSEFAKNKGFLMGYQKAQEW